MARIGMSPWMAAAGGLAGGIGQGAMLGMEMNLKRQQEEQRKQHDAMALLMQGMKEFGDNPEAAKQWTQYVSKVTGVPMPTDMMPWTSANPAERLAKQRDAMKAQGFTDPQINALLFGMKEAKPEKPNYIATPDPTAPGGIRYIQAPQGNIKTPPWAGPQYPVYGVTPEGIKPMPEISQPGRPGFVHIPEPKPDETTRQAPLTAADLKMYDAWEAQLNASRDPAEKTRIVNKIKAQGGEAQKTGKNQWTVIPPEFKKTVTSKGLAGNDTSELKKRIEEVKKKIAELKGQQ